VTGLAAQLAEREFEPIGVDLTELFKAGGSVKCCTLELRHEPPTGPLTELTTEPRPPR
jgi:hypothetical protein